MTLSREFLSNRENSTKLNKCNLLLTETCMYILTLNFWFFFSNYLDMVFVKMHFAFIEFQTLEVCKLSNGFWNKQKLKLFYPITIESCFGGIMVWLFSNKKFQFYCFRILYWMPCLVQKDMLKRAYVMDTKTDSKCFPDIKKRKERIMY